MANEISPSTNGSNGRDSRGRFARGNAGGPGNPNGRKVAELRSALLNAVSRRDVAEIVRKIKQQAKKGDISAARELLDRVLGKASQGVQLELQQPEAEEETERQPLTPEEEAVEFIDFYARFCVPKMAWLPGFLTRYEAWLEGYRRDTRPANFDHLVRLVESRCNLVRMVAAQPGRTRFAMLDTEDQIVDVEPMHGTYAGILDEEDGVAG